MDEHDFSDCIKYARTKLGLTQEQMAEVLGVTKETLSNVTITTEEDLRIYRRQPIGSFPWFGFPV